MYGVGNRLLTMKNTQISFKWKNHQRWDGDCRVGVVGFFLGKISSGFFSHLFICCCFFSFVYLLFTHGKFDIFHAGFTLNIATPMKFTLAPFLDLGLNCFESAIATHGRTPIRTFGVFFANPTMGSWKKNGEKLNFEFLRIF